jgi:hypothetical protein
MSPDGNSHAAKATGSTRGTSSVRTLGIILGGTLNEALILNKWQKETDLEDLEENPAGSKDPNRIFKRDRKLGQTVHRRRKIQWGK